MWMNMKAFKIPKEKYNAHAYIYAYHNVIAIQILKSIRCFVGASGK